MSPEVLARGVVEQLGVVPPDRWLALADRLRGPVLVKLSATHLGAWALRLGLGMRIRHAPLTTPEPLPGDQDLLFVSRRRHWVHASDYLGEVYLAPHAHEAERVGQVHLRLRTSRPTPLGRSRRERLETALQDDDATFLLEVRQLSSGLCVPLARVRLEALLPEEGRAVRLDAHRAAGRGLRPLGRWWERGLRPPALPTAAPSRASAGTPAAAAGSRRRARSAPPPAAPGRPSPRRAARRVRPAAAAAA